MIIEYVYPVVTKFIKRIYINTPSYIGTMYDVHSFEYDQSES